MRIEQVLITPEIAAQMLAKNTNNRPLSEIRVNAFAMQMKAGKWFEETAEAIKFCNGRLLDGQHRLAAIIKSKSNIKMTVATELKNEAFKYIDQVKPRFAADLFGIEGIENKNGLAAAIRFYLTTLKNDFTNLQTETRFGIKIKPTGAEILEEYQKRPSYWQEVFNLCAKEYYRKAGKLISPTWQSGWFFVLENYFDRETVERFFDLIFFDRKAFATTDLFYYRLVNTKTKGKYFELTQSFKHALFIKTWNSYILNKPIGKLDWRKNSRGEPFPALITSVNDSIKK